MWAARAGTFTVTTTADSGIGSFRQAILDVNANPGSNSIVFQISGPPPYTLNLLSALPVVSNSVVIDATTQPGYSSTPVVELNGAATTNGSAGLQFNSAFNVVRGLAINRFPAQGLVLNGVSNIIQGCFIGTDPTGTVARGNGDVGIWVKSSGNLIGGANTGNGNLISGGKSTGIYIQTGGHNIIQGNWIGLDRSGTNPLGNQYYGIFLSGSGGNLIGGAGVATRNVVSGNGQIGVYLSGSGEAGDLIVSNYIGLAVSGGAPVGNALDGITLSDAPSNTLSGNVVSANGRYGIFLTGGGATGNVLTKNYIGTDAAGGTALGNVTNGVTLFSGASGNIIGGTNAGAGNVISGNGQNGVVLAGGANQNLIQANFIGLSAAGTNALPNGFNGISISGGSSNTIGGASAAARNVISGNRTNGVAILLVTDVWNTVAGNYIGTDATGAKAIGNGLAGIRVQGCSNVISGNVISGNGQEGVFLVGTNGNVTGNMVAGNLIGLDAAGLNALGNSTAGIGISGASSNVIGGATAAARNVIAANGNTVFGLGGIFLVGPGATGNQLMGNYIGTSASGTTGRGNVNDGIYLQQAANNIIGGSAAGAGNVISANGVDGIYLTNSSGNVIQGNDIGTQADGASALGNTFHNIELDVNATNNVIGGSAPGAGNCIAFAQMALRSGVRVRNGSFNNLISGNSIFSNAFLGIDLGNNGVNPNVDCESGVPAGAANAGQNYPTLTNVYTGVGTQIRGTLNSAPGRTYLLQFFASPSGSPLGYGEGRVFLGQTNLTLGAACLSSFTVWLPAFVPAGWVVTATATDPANNTSEFSAWIPAITVPALKIGVISQTNRQFSLSWTNNEGNYVLQQTFNLTPPAQWANVTNAPLLTNGFFLLTVPATNENAFYRLAAP